MFPASFKPTTTAVASTEPGNESTSISALHHKPSAATENVLVLLHGYPQNHTLWYETVAELDKAGVLATWEVLIPDLPGYGQSRKAPSPAGSHFAHSKKAMAIDITALVDGVVGPAASFVVVGHDRGARVAFRLGHDFPHRVRGVCVQDILPAKFQFSKMSLEEGRHRMTFRSYHWFFLALPFPLPETMIGASSRFYMTYTIDSWTGPRHKGKHNPAALASWVNQYDDPSVITGSLEDYRAGATIDLDHDEADDVAGTAAVSPPVLIQYSHHLAKWFDVEGIWKKLSSAEYKAVKVGDEETGHFLPVEAAEESTRGIVEWMKTL